MVYCMQLPLIYRDNGGQKYQANLWVRALINHRDPMLGLEL